MKTYQQKPAEVERRWWLVDAQGKVLGRLASQVASLLRGKHKPTFTPHVDGGDFVVVVNADKVRLTGRKAERKVYYWHSGYPGGLKSATAGELLRTKPEELFRLAVQRMLPKTPLGRRMLRKLKVYRGPDHPHAAQQPQKLEVKG
ncbi:MAG: 50S ribosomal protein L13 [Armatimonadota bacterium]|nr:50S ribosomal protein L13 [Armatimonadota bacterium]MDR7444246.1 50S ribosomal protein L13 [Armatimonadota bacterium]MDR7570507.1 50S ribosomal protein L13 [Armatimonadota bacterium]MDR7614220.1 50S ribosomal protein L13 [Armatimonadota bacterium]